jgi:hypothetical protein
VVCDALEELLLRKCRDTQPVITSLRWLTVISIVISLIMLVGGTLELFYLAAPGEKGLIFHVFEFALKSATGLTIIACIIGRGLQRELLETQSELIALTKPENHRPPTRTSP